ncbi:hypothetical protein BGZ73_006144 [Actinomortierella ambigua]|nr:hypothetical protein BGZ73_006144 [Actinomortierella ambigua]
MRPAPNGPGSPSSQQQRPEDIKDSASHAGTQQQPSRRGSATVPGSGVQSPGFGSPMPPSSPSNLSLHGGATRQHHEHHPHQHYHLRHQHHHHHHARPTSYSPTRSRSASTRRLRGSGVFFNAIPAQLGLPPERFQQARTTEEQLRQIRGRGARKAAVQQYYRELNELLDAFQEVEEILQEHREYEKIRVENVQRKRREQLDRLDQIRDGTAAGLIDIGDELVGSGTSPDLDENRSAVDTTGEETGEETGARGANTAKATATTTATKALSPESLSHQPPRIIEHSPTESQNNDVNGYGSMRKQTPPDELAPPTSIVVHDSRNGSPVVGETSPLLGAGTARRSQRSSARMIELAINISMIANVALVLSKIWTVVMSASLAVLASMIDSLMDLLSGCIVWYSVRMRKDAKDGHKYPVGKARMEPLGVIVFGSIMMTSFAQVLLQSVERLLGGEEDHPVELDTVTLILLAANILIKLALWLWCRTIKNSSSVQALAQDHYIDVIFNIFSTFFPVAGKFLNLWWLDAAGAIALCIFIIYKWAETCLDNIRRLTGHAATAKDVQQLTYMAYRFSDLIEAVDTVRSYYVGDGLFVEVDIVMARDSPLPLAHDIGESLQEALECLDIVERAFVHIDIDVDHEIEHRKAVSRLLE